jgi:hypothetical protein
VRIDAISIPANQARLSTTVADSNPPVIPISVLPNVLLLMIVTGNAECSFFVAVRTMY